MPQTTPPIKLTLDPPARAWASLLRPPPEGARTRRFRAQLALPTDRPIVMSGHQVQFWHPGILAKLIAAHALARRTGAAVAWMLVDHESPSPSSLHFPAVDPDGRLRLRARPLDPADHAHGLKSPPFQPRSPELHPGWTPHPSVAHAIDELVHALRDHADAPDKAAQLTAAHFQRLTPIAPATVRVTDIARTDLFAECLERLRADPRAAHDAYNAAAAQHPDARVRPLADDPDWGLELPLWTSDPDGRRPAYSRRDLDDARPQRFIPRALLSTGLMRLAGCDLFIHGLGGAAYEPINDAWLVPLLAESGRAFAPFATASADVRLDLRDEPVTPQEAQRAHWRAHHARHHPALLGDDELQRRRDEIVRAIDDAPRYSPERKRLFADLRALLDHHKGERAAELDRLSAEARDLARAASEHGLRARRDWPAALYPEATLIALRDAIDARFDD